MSWLPKEKVVVPFDFSNESFEAIDTALQLAAAPADVYLVHILPEPSTMEPDVEWQEIELENRRQRTEEAIRRRLAGERYEGVQIEIDYGDPGFRIADFAFHLKADLIVISSHGRTGLKRILLGSVAERVIRLSHCPVLVLRK